MKLYVKDSKDDNSVRFLIYDELGNINYKASIQYTSLAVKLDVYNIHNKRVAKIRKRDIMSFCTYTISSKKKKIKVFGKFMEKKCDFYINGINWFFSGNKTWCNFDIINVDKTTVMSHYMKWGQFGSNYELNIIEEDKKLLCICIALCMEILILNFEKERSKEKSLDVVVKQPN